MQSLCRTKEAFITEERRRQCPYTVLVIFARETFNNTATVGWAHINLFSMGEVALQYPLEVLVCLLIIVI